MPQQGFNGQWVEIAKVGKFFDSRGVERDLTPALLSAIAANYNDGEDPAALTIGHPKHAAPAFGWVSALRVNGDLLEMQAEDTSDEFEDMVRTGRFRTRSAGIWLTHPSMKAPTIDHVAFLGAEAPAVKGLKQIQFSESAEGERIDLESPINLQEKKMEEKDFGQMPESFWETLKKKLGIGEKTEMNEQTPRPDYTPSGQGDKVELTEAAVKEMAKAAVEEAKVEFAEQIKGLKAENEELKKKVDGQIAGGVKAEIASFVEGLKAEKGKHILKNMGVAGFLESQAIADAADPKAAEAICFSEGTGDDKVEHKFSRLEYAKELISNIAPLVEFGEKYGKLVAGPEADASINPERVEAMKKAAGVETKGGKD